MPKTSDLPTRFSRSALDQDATAAIEHLQRAGFEAYFVGGCVRDLLLGRKPKDFDIVTDATPPQLKRLFRNCRLIGRRFRLAHLYYGAKIIEAATFRGASSEDGQSRLEDAASIERTNTFGTPEEDAFSRDFTVNALFYDPVRARVIDYVGGLKDVAARRLHTIGDPMRRFQEDPVRILRAVKFASRLGFAVAPDVLEAMSTQAHLIETCPTPRVTEEIFRIAESRHFELALPIMRSHGVLEVVLPELSEAFSTEERRDRLFRLARIVDRLGSAHDGTPRELLYCLVVLGLLPRPPAARPERRGWWSVAAGEATAELGPRMQIPERLRSAQRAAYDLLDTMLAPEPPRKRKIRAVVSSPAFGHALTLIRVLAQLDGGHSEAYATWTARANGAAEPPTPAAPPARDPELPRTSSRRGGRRRRRGTAAEAPQAPETT